MPTFVMGDQQIEGHSTFAAAAVALQHIAKLQQDAEDVRCHTILQPQAVQSPAEFFEQLFKEWTAGHVAYTKPRDVPAHKLAAGEGKDYLYSAEQRPSDAISGLINSYEAAIHF
jgi:hypothetical protein